MTHSEYVMEKALATRVEQPYWVGDRPQLASYPLTSTHYPGPMHSLFEVAKKLAAEIEHGRLQALEKRKVE